MYQHYPIWGPENFSQIGIFGLKTNHLATLAVSTTLALQLTIIPRFWSRAEAYIPTCTYLSTYVYAHNDINRLFLILTVFVRKNDCKRTKTKTKTSKFHTLIIFLFFAFQFCVEKKSTFPDPLQQEKRLKDFWWQFQISLGSMLWSIFCCFHLGKKIDSTSLLIEYMYESWLWKIIIFLARPSTGFILGREIESRQGFICTICTFP
jgi:hypothetical protein